MASLRASATAFLKRFSISVIALFLVVVWTSPLGSGAAADDEPLGVGNHTEFMAATYRTEISGRDASIYILIDSQKFFEIVPLLQAMGEINPTLTPADVKARLHLVLGTYCFTATSVALMDVFDRTKVGAIYVYCGGL